MTLLNSKKFCAILTTLLGPLAAIGSGQHNLAPAATRALSAPLEKARAGAGPLFSKGVHHLMPGALPIPGSRPNLPGIFTPSRHRSKYTSHP